MDEELKPWVPRAPIDPYCDRFPHFLGVADANAILSSIDNDCRRGDGWRSRLLRMADHGAAVLYAADHVYGEVYEYLPKMALASGLSVDVLRVHFEDEYLPALRFVTVSSVDGPDAQVAAITDLDDVPTGRLAKLIGPCVVFSEDKHLKKPGLAPKNWRQAAGSAVDIADGAMDQVMTANLAMLPARGAVELVKFAGRRTGISPWLLGSAVLGLGYLYVRKTAQRREVVNKVFLAFAESFGKLLDEAMTLEASGLAALREVILPAPSSPTIRQQVAIVLARQTKPLLAKEIYELLQEHFVDASLPTLAEVRQTLEEGPEFVRVERYRWQFGREAGPWRGEYRVG